MYLSFNFMQHGILEIFPRLALFQKIYSLLIPDPGICIMISENDRVKILEIAKKYNVSRVFLFGQVWTKRKRLTILIWALRV